MFAKLVQVFAVGLVLLGLVAGTAQAQSAKPPYGTWRGQAQDGAIVTMMLTEQGFYLHTPGILPVTGRCTWEAYTATGGTITVYGPSVPYQQKWFYQVLWLGRDRIQLSGGFRVVLNRVN
jgi:hypothetical protein